MATANSTLEPINLNDPQPWANRKSVVYGLVITFLCSSWLCVLIRLYVRLKVIRRPGWDDFFVFLYAIFTTIGSISILLSVNYGLGQHFYLITDDQRESYLKTYYVMNGCYIVSTSLIKLALLFQYMRVYGPGQVMHKMTLFTAVFVGLWGFSYSFIAWVPCVPVRSAWEDPLHGNCWGYGSPIASQFVATYESHTSTNMILDFIVLLIPLPLLFKEATAFRQRMRILGLLFMGSLVIMLAIWRLATIVDHQAATWPIKDVTWYGPSSIILAVLEIDAAAICASIPIFWPVLEEKWGTIFITQEIKITREERFMDDDEADNFSVRHSRTGSDVELKRAENGDAAARSHYQDSYVLKSVDPLRYGADAVPRVEAVVESDGPRGGPSNRWHL